MRGWLAGCLADVCFSWAFARYPSEKGIDTSNSLLTASVFSKEMGGYASQGERPSLIAMRQRFSLAQAFQHYTRAGSGVDRNLLGLTPRLDWLRLR